MSSSFRHRVLFLGVCTLGLLGAHTPGTIRTAGAVTCATPQVDRVAVVIDFEAAPGAPAGLLATCATVPDRATGLTALRAAAGSIGQDASGKVCQIAGIPATFDHANCSAPQNGRVSYWAYFHGSATGWSYSNVGAAGWRVRPEVVEGWHFIEIPAGQLQTYPPPRNFTNAASYDWQATCPAAPMATNPARPQVTAAPGAVPPAPPSDDDRDPVADGADPADVVTTGRAGGTLPATTVTSVATTTSGAPTTGAPEVGRETASGLRSTDTAPRVSRAEVDAAAAASTGSSRGAILAGVGGIGVVAFGLGFVTYRSRKHRLDESAD